MNRNQKCVYYFRFVNNNYTGALTLCQMSLTGMVQMDID